ncbi:MAG: polysaccharide biosynthesis protein, partial [Erysipelotrichaceae bacterium]|nr:polysaccharide biosynthesis protein [Erysipelotrichaceae bacterium]
MKKITETLNRRIEHWQVIALLLILYDAIAVNISYFLALLFRFDLKYLSVPKVYLTGFYKFAPYYTLFCLIVFYTLRLYRSLWRFASLYELIRIIMATFITLAFQIMGILFIGRMPVLYYVGGATIQLIMLVAIRFGYRFVLLLRSQRRNIENYNKIMLIGAGSAGQLLIRDNSRNPYSKDKIVCIIDDNLNKVGRYIDSIPIVGTRDDILNNVDKYGIDTIYMAIPSANNEDKRDILNICKETDCKIKTLPGIYSPSDVI